MAQRRYSPAFRIERSDWEHYDIRKVIRGHHQPRQLKNQTTGVEGVGSWVN
jgi:hypothetical protein